MDLPSWEHDLKVDLETINALLESMAKVTAEDDAKLQHLKALILTKPDRPHRLDQQDHPAGKLLARCNHILKSWTVQSAQKIHLYGPPELKDRITRWNANGQHGIFAASRRNLRLLRSLVLNQTPYLDPASRSSTASNQERADAALRAWLILIRK